VVQGFGHFSSVDLVTQAQLNSCGCNLADDDTLQKGVGMWTPQTACLACACGNGKINGKESFCKIAGADIPAWDWCDSEGTQKVCGQTCCMWENGCELQLNCPTPAPTSSESAISTKIEEVAGSTVGAVALFKFFTYVTGAGKIQDRITLNPEEMSKVDELMKEIDTVSSNKNIGWKAYQNLKEKGDVDISADTFKTEYQSLSEEQTNYAEFVNEWKALSANKGELKKVLGGLDEEYQSAFKGLRFGGQDLYFWAAGPKQKLAYETYTKIKTENSDDFPEVYAQSQEEVALAGLGSAGIRLNKNNIKVIEDISQNPDLDQEDALAYYTQLVQNSENEISPVVEGELTLNQEFNTIEKQFGGADQGEVKEALNTMLKNDPTVLENDDDNAADLDKSFDSALEQEVSSGTASSGSGGGGLLPTNDNAPDEDGDSSLEQLGENALEDAEDL
jgi:hypothetical protein